MDALSEAKLTAMMYWSARLGVKDPELELLDQPVPLDQLRRLSDLLRVPCE
jgi:hypothetical protein